MVKHFGSFCISLFLISFLLISNNSFSQEFLPKLDQFKSLQRDSNNFYFKEIWIKSKDVSFNDPDGYIRRAADKIDLGYFSEALSDVEKAIGIDSTISQSYYIRGYIMFKFDSITSALADFKKAIALKNPNIYNYFFSANIYTAMGKYKEADSLYNIVIKTDDKFVDAHFGLANLHFLKSELKQAENEYKRVIDINPGYSPAYMNLALIYAYSEPAKALRYLDKSIDINPAFAHSYYIRGTIRLGQDQVHDAVKDWDKAIEIDSANTLYRISRAFLNISMNNYFDGFYELLKTFSSSKSQNYVSDFEESPKAQEINDFISQIITYNTFVSGITDPEKEKLIEALCLFSIGNHISAENIYKDLPGTSSSAGLIHYLRGFNTEYLYNSELALTTYTKALREKPFPKETYLRLGNVNYNMNRFQEAIKNLNIYISDNDSTKLAYRLRGHSHGQLSHFESAVNDYNKFLSIDSTETDIYFNRALCYKEMEKYPEAIRDYQRIIKYKENDFESIGLLAECRYLSGDTLGAYNLLNQAYTKLSFLNERGFFLRGTLNLHYKNYEAAIIDFDNIIKNNIRYTEAFTSRGIAYYCRNEYAKAKKDLTSALSLNGKDVVALYSRGLVNIKLNKLEEAYYDLQNANRLGHPLAKRALLIYLKDFNPDVKSTQ